MFDEKPHAGRDAVMAKRAAFNLVDEKSNSLFMSVTNMRLGTSTHEEFRKALADMLASLMVAGEVGLMGEEAEFQVLLQASVTAMQPQFPCHDFTGIFEDLHGG